MLILKRKRHERIFLTGGIVIEVDEAEHGYARLAILAPDNIRILREEIVDRADPEFGPLLQQAR